MVQPFVKNVELATKYDEFPLSQRVGLVVDPAKVIRGASRVAYAAIKLIDFL